MEILGYILAIFIGITLGLIGGGGSILAVPILAYLFQYDEKVATSYSLFIVGSAALLGGIRKHFEKNVIWKVVFSFGIPTVLGVMFARNFIIPNLPEVIFTIKEFVFTRRMLMFGIFTILMLLASFNMVTTKEYDQEKNTNNNFVQLTLQGGMVGIITGIVGAGGGFLIIPALITIGKLPIKKAIGTSLMIVSMNGILGFLFSKNPNFTIDWEFLSIFTSLTLIGIFIGTYLSRFIDGSQLKKGFGYFIIVMAIFIFFKEFIIQA